MEETGPNPDCSFYKPVSTSRIDPVATACTIESGHLTLLSGAGEGEVVSKEVGEEERGAQGGVP